MGKVKHIEIEKMRPLVTVIMPCYNHEAYVEQALQSAFDQDYLNFEVVIRDDFSTDRSAEKIKEFFRGFSNVNNIPYKIEYGTENLGIVKSVNRLLNLARGEIIFSFASDDILMTDRLSYVVEKSNRYKEIDLFVNDAEVIDADGQVLRKSFYNFDSTSFGSHARCLGGEDFIISNENYRFASGLNFGGFGMAMRKRLLKEFAYQIPSHLYYEDYFMSFLGIVQGGVYFTNRKLLQYRRTGNNISSTTKKNNVNEIIEGEAKSLQRANSVEYEKIKFLRTGTIADNLFSKRKLMILLLKQNVVMNKMVISLVDKNSRFLLTMELLWLIIMGPKRKICLHFFLKSFSKDALVSLAIIKFKEREIWAA